MAVDGGNARVTHHLDDGEQVTRIAPALRDVRRAGVAEVEELRFLAGQLVPEDIGGDREQAFPLLADVDVRPARFAKPWKKVSVPLPVVTHGERPVTGVVPERLRRGSMP